MTVQFVHQLDGLRRRSVRLGDLVQDILREACESIFHTDDALARRVVARDCDVDVEEVAIEREVIRLLALYQPVGSDLRLLCAILKVTNDLERVADCAVNIAERAGRLTMDVNHWEGQAIRDLGRLVGQTLGEAIGSYSDQCDSAASAVLTRDTEIDGMYAGFVRRLVAESPSETRSLSVNLDLLSIAKNLERIADHAMNVAEDVIYFRTGSIIRHKLGTSRNGPSREANGGPLP